MDESLDALVRRVDEDRWLASRFARAPARRRLIALYAVNYEIARTAEVVSQAALGDIRLEWWRAGLEELLQGRAPRHHPALAALGRTLRGSASIQKLQAIVQERARDLEPAPFATWSDLETYLDVTVGNLMQLAMEACDAAAQDFVRPAARAWGYVGLLRAAGLWRAAGRSLLPRQAGDEAEMMRRAQTCYAEARALAPGISAAAFGAIGHVALLGGYLRALDKGATDTPLLSRQLKLVVAAATGRV